jgi:PEP-CTERM motif
MSGGIMKRNLLIAAIGGLLIVAPVTATTINFTAGPLNGTGFGNNISITADGVTATLTAFSATSLTSSFTTSQIKLWSTGIGTCNQGEGLNCGSGPHTVDNDGYGEILVISFTQSVIMDTATISAWARDFDAMFWGGSGPLSLTTFDALGIGTLDAFAPNNANTNGTTVRDVSLAPLGGPVDWLIFGPPPFSWNPDDKKDLFKFKGIAFHVPEEDTPEPGVLALLAIGTALLAARRKRT